MRCIEMGDGSDSRNDPEMINRNMRCIEIAVNIRLRAVKYD